MPRAKQTMIEDKTRVELLADLTTAGFDDVSQVGSDVTEGDITRATYNCTWRSGSIATARNCLMQIKLLGDPVNEKAAWEAASARWLTQVSRERQIALKTVWPEYVTAVEAGYNFGGSDGTVVARWPDPDSVRVILDNDGEAPPRRYGIIEFREQVVLSASAEFDPAAIGTYEIITRRILYNRDTTNNRFSWRVYDYVAPPITA